MGRLEGSGRKVAYCDAPDITSSPNLHPYLVSNDTGQTPQRALSIPDSAYFPEINYKHSY